MENTEFLIPLNGLAGLDSEFQWHAGKEFFESFENAEILDAEIVANAAARKAGDCVEVDCTLKGSVVVSCDRCLADLNLPVDVEIALSVRHEGQQAAEEPDRETIIIPAEESALDMSQIIYDWTCISLPLRKVHPDGECDPEVVRHLGIEPEVEAYIEADADEGDTVGNNPFASLKNLFEN